MDNLYNSGLGIATFEFLCYYLVKTHGFLTNIQNSDGIPMKLWVALLTFKEKF